MLRETYTELIAFLNVTSEQDPLFYYSKTILLALLAAVGIRLGTRLLKFLLRYTAVAPGLQGIIASVIQIALWLGLIIQLLLAFHFDATVTFFSSSALAVGILLAAGGTTLLSDIVAGVFLAQDSDFAVGDEVVAGENSTRGVIESMDARRTRIRAEDGVLHVIPNSLVERKEWQLIRRGETVSPIAQAVRRARRIRTARRQSTTAAATPTPAPAVAVEQTSKPAARIRKNN